MLLSKQCKEIEENNRMGKTKDIFKKTRDTKGTLPAVTAQEHGQQELPRTQGLPHTQGQWHWPRGATPHPR